MIQKLLAKYSNRFLSKWVVLIFDVFVSMLMMIIATVLRHNFDYLSIDPNSLETHTFFTGIVYTIGFLFTQSFAGIIRHTSINDAARIIRGAFFAFFGLMMLSTIYTMLGYNSAFAIPRSIIIIHFLLTIFVLIGSRFFIKAIYKTALNSEKNLKRTKVLIYGAGASGLMTKSTLTQDSKRSWEVLGFIDDNPSKARKQLEGIPVYTSAVLNENYIVKNQVNELVLSMQNIEPDRKKEIVEKGLQLNLKVKVVPAHEKWINGELSTKQLRTVQIEELLERDPINLNNQNLKAELKGKTILVTGAAGSIGSEIVRQVLHYQPKKVVLVDQAESPLYNLEQ
jgi:FlaA1/EpsC-like NDP-sugar epimerase